MMAIETSAIAAFISTPEEFTLNNSCIRTVFFHFRQYIKTEMAQ